MNYKQTRVFLPEICQLYQYLKCQEIAITARANHLGTKSQLEKLNRLIYLNYG